MQIGDPVSIKAGVVMARSARVTKTSTVGRMTGVPLVKVSVIRQGKTPMLPGSGLPDSYDVGLRVGPYVLNYDPPSPPVIHIVKSHCKLMRRFCCSHHFVPDDTHPHSDQR